MKKFLLISVLCCSVFILCGCSIDWNNEKDQRITQLEQQVKKLESTNLQLKEEDLFEKKLQCSNKFVDIEKIITSNNPEYLEAVEEVFYSPSLDTCLYTSRSSTLINDTWYVMSYNITDALTLEDLYNFYLTDYGEDFIGDDLKYLQVTSKVRNQILKDKVQELKGE